MTPTAMSEKYECRRKGSRAWVLERCSSMKGRCAASSASRSAMLVCVKAPGVKLPRGTPCAETRWRARLGAINRGLAGAEQIEVRTVQQQHSGHGVRVFLSVWIHRKRRECT